MRFHVERPQQSPDSGCKMLYLSSRQPLKSKISFLQPKTSVSGTSSDHGRQNFLGDRFSGLGFRIAEKGVVALSATGFLELLFAMIGKIPGTIYKIPGAIFKNPGTIVVDHLSGPQPKKGYLQTFHRR